MKISLFMQKQNHQLKQAEIHTWWHMVDRYSVYHMSSAYNNVHVFTLLSESICKYEICGNNKLDRMLHCLVLFCSSVFRSCLLSVFLSSSSTWIEDDRERKLLHCLNWDQLFTVFFCFCLFPVSFSKIWAIFTKECFLHSFVAPAPGQPSWEMFILWVMKSNYTTMNLWTCAWPGLYCPCCRDTRNLKPTYIIFFNFFFFFTFW